MATKEEILEALKGVVDPHTGASLVEMGLIKEIEISKAGKARIKMTLTTPHCPLAEFLVQQVKESAAAVKGITSAEVELVF